LFERLFESLSIGFSDWKGCPAVKRYGRPSRLADFPKVYHIRLMDAKEAVRVCIEDTLEITKDNQRFLSGNMDTEIGSHTFHI